MKITAQCNCTIAHNIEDCTESFHSRDLRLSREMKCFRTPSAPFRLWHLAFASPRRSDIKTRRSDINKFVNLQVDLIWTLCVSLYLSTDLAWCKVQFSVRGVPSRNTAVWGNSRASQWNDPWDFAQSSENFAIVCRGCKFQCIPELQNVNPFTQSKTFKPNFTRRKTA